MNESEEPLENALFGLFNTDCTEFTADNAIVTAKSDKQGKFELAEVIYGEYIVREIEDPDGYILSDKKYPVTISEDGEIVEITAKNKPVTVETSKRDVYGNELTESAIFTIYRRFMSRRKSMNRTVWCCSRPVRMSSKMREQC